MSDQITSCTQQNDSSGNPLSYLLTYEFDSGNGQTTTQVIEVLGASLSDPADPTQAVAAANVIAAGMKARWLTAISHPVPVNVTSVVGPVTLPPS